MNVGRAFSVPHSTQYLQRQRRDDPVFEQEMFGFQGRAVFERNAGVLRRGPDAHIHVLRGQSQAGQEHGAEQQAGAGARRLRAITDLERNRGVSGIAFPCLSMRSILPDDPSPKQSKQA